MDLMDNFYNFEILDDTKKDKAPSFRSEIRDTYVKKEKETIASIKLSRRAAMLEIEREEMERDLDILKIHPARMPARDRNS